MSSREAVLSLLRGEEGFLSGQELSRRLGLTREIGRASCRERV